MMKGLLAALRFLTILPIPGDWGVAEADLARSVPWFPIVGLLLGIIAAIAASGLEMMTAPMVCAAGVVLLLMSFSGCMHLDGLADAADGLLSSRPRDRMLEIMKDSRTGAMGVAAVVAVVLTKFAALSSLTPGTTGRAVFLMPLAGRCTLVVHMALLPYARSGGLGSVFYRGGAKWAAIWAIGLLGATGWGMLGIDGLIVCLACLIVALAAAWYVYVKIGGATGDTLGAACELVEIVPALILSLQPLEAAR